MTPNFAAAVDPIFLRVLGLLDRIGRNEPLSAASEFQEFQNQFRQAEARIGEINGWELAKYALAAWIDDVLIEAPWEGREWWENNSLEFSYFKTRDRATEFFTRASQASELSRRDILEVFYICVVLGFRGLYGLSNAAFLADGLNQPPNLSSWAQRTSRAIQLGHGRTGARETLRTGGGAPPLDGKFRFVGSILVAILLSAITSVVAWFVLLDG